MYGVVGGEDQREPEEADRLEREAHDDERLASPTLREDAHDGREQHRHAGPRENSNPAPSGE